MRADSPRRPRDGGRPRRLSPGDPRDLFDPRHHHAPPSARGNPYRPLIEYFADWKLIERTEEEIIDYCVRAGVQRDVIRVTRESTGLTLIIEIQQQELR